jgi:pyruvate formate lyase activating enzyme
MGTSKFENAPETAAEALGLVLQIQRMSTEDGPGLRSTAFLKGCPLSCAWCHNPESISPSPEIQWIGSRCIAGTTRDGCGACVAACPEGALTRSESGALVIDREACRNASAGRAAVGGGPCGFACSSACPGGAVERLGEKWRASELALELLKDRSYFERSDRGGITLSGGEASAQCAFAREVLRAAKDAGVHTALDTCGFAGWESLAACRTFIQGEFTLPEESRSLME